MNDDQTRAATVRDEKPPKRLRLPLATVEDVRRELARLYREGKAGLRDVSDVSKLANVLQILGRMIATSDLEARIEALEAAGGPVAGANGHGGARVWGH